ncbi:MAG TPA: Gfo/Idh/MocA family oxidoreductase [Chthonomonadaceae bacterium]|nr:Gfo/Idh/MocA family oxidoreductase [Chthonomonadaceae bacterium]
MSGNVRVGIVGASWWSDWMHLPNLKSHPQAEVVAICGRRPERAGALAQKYAIPQVFTDYQAMIRNAGLDALLVATPDDMHHPITMAALEAGLHVLCEKSLARNSEQAREMAETARARGVKNMVYFTLRGLPAQRYVKELLSDGYIGRGYHCHIQHFMGYGRSGGFGWRFDPARGLGALGDLGSHAIDLARWYFGDIVRVCAQLDHFVTRRNAEGAAVEAACDAALLSVEFASGAQGVVHVSTVAHVGERQIQEQIALHGEAGTIEAGMSLYNMEARGVRGEEKAFQPLPIPDKFWGDADRSNPFSVFTHLSVGTRAFIDAILEDRPASPDFTDGWKVQQVMDAALRSQETGAWVTIG